MNAIEVSDLTKSYGDFTLDRLNFALPQGGIMGLIGENGAGKSTTIKLILNMIHRDGGSVSLFGKDNRSNIESIREDIGIVLDEVGIPGCLTPLQVGKIMRRSFKNWDGEAYEGCLRMFSLPKDKKIKEFSRGTKKKLGLAVALSHHAKLLILDEATSGLDPVIRDEILDMFNEFTRDEGHSILISSHIVSDLEKICDYITFLHKGKLLLCEEKDVLKEKYGVVRCSKEELREWDPASVLGAKSNPYGVEAIVRRDAAPAGSKLQAADIEQLFVIMARKDR